jgi:hypothetical protein
MPRSRVLANMCRFSQIGNERVGMAPYGDYLTRSGKQPSITPFADAEISPPQDIV